jgi:pyruvate dehydrogenase (quinone)
MARIASDALIERLADWGVDTVFGLPGDGINGIMEGLRRHRDRVRFVLVHHEEAAAFMACGYAKATGRLGVCLATSGPGGIHLLNGLYDAKLDHAPVLAITGMQATKVLGTMFQQEVYLDRLYQDVAAYNAMVHLPPSIPALVDDAVRTSLSARTVSHLTFPVDLQEAPADADPWEGGLGTGRTPQTAPPRCSTIATRWCCWPGWARSAPATSCWPSPTRWPARSSRPCRARPPCPTTTR